MNTTAVRTPGIVTIGGRDYATPAAWSRATPGTSPEQVRRAAHVGQLGNETVPMSPNGKIKAYPVDVLTAWEATRRDTGPGGTPTDSPYAVARQLGVTRMRVWRALKAGLIKGTKDTTGAWRLDPASIEAWKHQGMPAPRPEHHK